MIAYRQVPHRLAAREPGRLTGGPPRSGRRLAARLPVPGVEGLRLALEPGRGRTAVPVRSVLAGAVLAMTVVSATLTFGASLTTLVSHPALYGWNFSYALYAVQGWGSVPARWAGPLLARDRLVAATTGVDFVTVQIDGQTVPALVAPTRPAVAPHILSGHGLDGSHELVLGPATLAQLHQRVGGTVTLASGSFHVRLTIAGTATMPAIGGVLSVHTSMSTGALFSTAILPGGAPSPARSVRSCPGPTPSSSGCGPGSARRPACDRCRRISRQLTGDAELAAGAGRQRRRLGRGHRRSAAGPAAGRDRELPHDGRHAGGAGRRPGRRGGGRASGLTLVASVRRRRRDFALLKTLGFTRGQLAGAVAWQSSAIAVIGLVIGVPLGIAAGRWLWLAFAHQLSAVPDPVVPAGSIALAAAGRPGPGQPGRRAARPAAARTPAALLLRAE